MNEPPTNVEFRGGLQLEPLKSRLKEYLKWKLCSSICNIWSLFVTTAIWCFNSCTNVFLRLDIKTLLNNLTCGGYYQAKIISILFIVAPKGSPLQNAFR